MAFQRTPPSDPPLSPQGIYKTICRLSRSSGLVPPQSKVHKNADRGRLGLEIEDPNNQEVGIAQPLLSAYRDIIHEDYFSPQMTVKEEVSLPAKLRWGGAEDADGLCSFNTLQKRL